MAVKVKKLEETEEITPEIEEIPEKQEFATVHIKPNAPELVKSEVKTEKFGIKDIVGLTEEQKDLLFMDGLQKLLQKSGKRGFTLVRFSASEGYPRTQSGVVAMSEDNLREVIEYYTVNKGPITGEALINILVKAYGDTVYQAYPMISVMDLP